AWQPGQVGIAAAGGADRRSARRRGRADESIARSAPYGAAPPPAREGPTLRLLQVVADYTRVSAVQVAGRAGDGRASAPQYPGVSTSPGLLAEEARWRWRA